ncbi:MAG: TIGR01212 family radical SAM protein, partial [Bacteroidales bacterium]|nr:TIGR01212 family radical SAM protein [Bacteroidales bacterium]
ASILSRLPLTSVKFHQLQLFNGTRMAEEYLTDPAAFHLFEKAEYLNLMVEYIELLNPRIVVERIAGETPPRFALQQPWGPRYDQLLKEFETLLEQKNSWQGKHYIQPV